VQSGALPDDPEIVEYEPVRPELADQMRAAFTRRFRDGLAAVRPDLLARYPELVEAVRLDRVGRSVFVAPDGIAWLGLWDNAGSHWYVGWYGDAADAITVAQEFGSSLARDWWP
jgi:hypothetical protein